MGYGGEYAKMRRWEDEKRRSPLWETPQVLASDTLCTELLRSYFY